MCQLSIYNSFPVIRTTVAKFYVPRPSFFVCPGDALWQSRKTLHEWKDNSVLAKPLAACTHLSSIVFQLFEPQVQKIAVFTYHSQHFCFPWIRPCDYHAICCMDGKSIQCLPKPSQHVPIYLEYFPSYTMLKSMRKSKNCYFLPHFGSPWRRPCGNLAKCCMDGKRIRYLQIVSLHVLI